MQGQTVSKFIVHYFSSTTSFRMHFWQHLAFDTGSIVTLLPHIQTSFCTSLYRVH